MNLIEKNSFCPYCGEPISLLVDSSVSEQNYTEDCEVCCKPMVIHVSVFTEDDILLDVKSEND